MVDNVKGEGLLFLGPCSLRLPDLSIKYFDIFYTGAGALNCPTGSAHGHGFSNLSYQAKIWVQYGDLMHYILCPLYHNLFDKIHILFGIMTIYCMHFSF